MPCPRPSRRTRRRHGSPASGPITRTACAHGSAGRLATYGKAAKLAGMDGGDRTHLLTAIIQGLSPLEQVRAALLFGSRATGRARPDSDVDVAVLLSPDAAKSGKDVLERVLSALASGLAADRLDVVILNAAPPALAFQILKHGVVAFERDRRDLHRLRVRVYDVHADYAHVERFFREAVKRRALAGASRG